MLVAGGLPLYIMGLKAMRKISGECVPLEDSSFDLEVLGTPVLGGNAC